MENRLKPRPYKSTPMDFNIVVSSPSVPSVAMKENASGTPPKLAATAEKLVTSARNLPAAGFCSA